MVECVVNTRRQAVRARLHNPPRPLARITFPLPFVFSSLLRMLTPLFPLDANHSPATPLFPLHTQKQGGGGVPENRVVANQRPAIRRTRSPALILRLATSHSSLATIFNHSRTYETVARKSNHSRTYAKTGGCLPHNVPSQNSFVFFHSVNYMIHYMIHYIVGAPTFLRRLARILLPFPILLNLQLKTYNLELPRRPGVP